MSLFSNNPKCIGSVADNELRITMEYMIGDADGYTEYRSSCPVEWKDFVEKWVKLAIGYDRDRVEASGFTRTRDEVREFYVEALQFYKTCGNDYFEDWEEEDVLASLPIKLVDKEDANNTITFTKDDMEFAKLLAFPGAEIDRNFSYYARLYHIDIIEVKDGKLYELFSKSFNDQ